MIITYTPENGERQRWAFRPDAIRASDAELIEKRFGASFREFHGAVVQGSVRARRVLLWHFLRQQHHTLRYEDTPDFATGELKVEMTRGELISIRDQVARRNIDNRDQIIEQLESEIADAEDDDEGKATSSDAA